MEVNLIHQPLVSRDLSLNRRKERRTNMEDLIDVDGFKIQVKQKHLNLFLSINTFDTIKDLHLFARKLIFKKMFHSQSSSAVCSTREDLHTLQMLEELAAESNISNDKKWFPSTLTPRSYTTDALRRLEGIHMDPDMMVVTCDVESLYTSIRHTDGMEAVKRFFQMSEFEESIENQLLQMPSFMPTLPIQPN
ncbi:uncharacterized protein LOC130282519 isoform X3 [Hyla sarda]|uniref:uncharacterized protein LOC130282519 isoform X3 n=1 Tax=Hyla sarda TaxID=327740 RepID=UPI0024C30A29|nr:uncharacterized protein LOC130282519 isoform X3 [Hyla sarda]